jgi:pilus assembly protein CpaE
MAVATLPGSELATLAHSSSAQPVVVVVDLRGQSHLPAALPLLRRQRPTMGVIIVASTLDPVLMLEAMRAGVNECVAEPFTSADLEAAIARVTVHPPQTDKSAQVFAFLGAKGGVGTTTVAVNTATALAQIDPDSTLLIDLHLANGDAAVFLGVETRFSVVDALENTHRLDEAYFRNLIVRTKPGVDVLASSDRALVSPVDPRRIRVLLEFAAGQYRYVVLDVPRVDASVLDSLESATRLVIVANQEFVTVRNAYRMATAMRKRYGSDKVSVVVSRSDRLAEIGHEDVERAVGGPVKHTFPSDYRLALDAVNKGRPLSLDNHNELSQSFHKFARDLAGVTKPAQAAQPTSLLGRLTRRRPAKVG